MKGLMVMVALAGIGFLARPCDAQGNVFCENFLRDGDGTNLKVCIQYLDRQAGIVEQERGYELAGVTMSNADLTKSVKDLHASQHDIEERLGKINPYAVSDIRLLTDDLRDHAKELEKQVDAQGILLDAQSQQIADLRKQLDEMRTELATEHAHAPKTQHPSAPSKANPVKTTTPPQ